MEKTPNLKEVSEIQIHKTTEDPFSVNGAMNIPAMLIPSFRVVKAVEAGVQNNILIRTHGGLGDVICAEPAIRWALEQFDADISIETYFPELFGHLQFKEVHNPKVRFPDYDKYLVYDTLHTEEVMHWEFLAHSFMHVVDHHSITMWKSQLPIASKEIKLVPSDADYEVADIHITPKEDVIIHAGRTWQSRTVPTWFWNKTIAEIVKLGSRPVLIGKESHAMVGNLPVDTRACLDLRDQLSIMETVACLHRGQVLLTNDSSPLHMAASGEAAIGVLSTVKHPDLLKHWRHGQCGWRMDNFTSGGMWQLIEMCPNSAKHIKLDNVDQKLLDSWLPNPEELAKWAVTQIRQ